METKITCPLGSECEEARDGVLYQCAWYQKIVGTDAQGNDHDEYGCAIAWMPILLIEQVRGLAGIQAATESGRNETVKGLQSLSAIVSNQHLVPRLKVIEGDT